MLFKVTMSLAAISLVLIYLGVYDVAYWKGYHRGGKDVLRMLERDLEKENQRRIDEGEDDGDEFCG